VQHPAQRRVFSDRCHNLARVNFTFRKLFGSIAQQAARTNPRSPGKLPTSASTARRRSLAWQAVSARFRMEFAIVGNTSDKAATFSRSTQGGTANGWLAGDSR
jgi:hypothetical protein